MSWAMAGIGSISAASVHPRLRTDLDVMALSPRDISDEAIMNTASAGV
jgi:hypothetical protein